VVVADEGFDTDEDDHDSDDDDESEDEAENTDMRIKKAMKRTMMRKSTWLKKGPAEETRRPGLMATKMMGRRMRAWKRVARIPARRLMTRHLDRESRACRARMFLKV